jgi:hypothetical protein
MVHLKINFCYGCLAYIQSLQSEIWTCGSCGQQTAQMKVPKILSWDLTGYPEQNIIRIGTEDRRFRLLDDPLGWKIIRIALHPRDPHGLEGV